MKHCEALCSGERAGYDLATMLGDFTAIYAPEPERMRRVAELYERTGRLPNKGGLAQLAQAEQEGVVGEGRDNSCVTLQDGAR